MGRSLYTKTLGTGKDLILLHGWGFHSGIYRSLAKILSLEYRVTLVDLPGFGRSTMHHPFNTIEPLALEILKYVPKGAIWVGWSLGGLIALWVARHFPEYVTQLITICCNPKFIQQKNEIEEVWPGVTDFDLGLFAKSLALDFQKTISRFLLLQCYHNDHQNKKEMIGKIKKEIFSVNVPSPSLSAVFEGLNLLRKIDLRECLSQIQCTSLHVFGEKDILVPVKVIDRLKLYLSMSTSKSHIQVIPQAGHLPFLSHETIFVNHIKSFLQQ